MSDKIKEQTKIPPDLDDLLDELKNEIFANLNCIQIGKIESINTSEQTVEVAIQVKRRVDVDKTQNYPLLVDVPIIVLQGDGTFLELPIKVGDYCLVFFNDRCIDTWWDSGNLAEPLTTRKHDLSDGFALVGINPKTSVLSLDNDKVKLQATGYPVTIETDDDITVKTTGVANKIIIETGANGICNIKAKNVNIGGDETLTEALIKGAAFITELLTAFNTHTHNFSGTGSVLTPTVPWTEIVNFPNSKSINNKTS